MLNVVLLILLSTGVLGLGHLNPQRSSAIRSSRRISWIVLSAAIGLAVATVLIRVNHILAGDPVQAPPNEDQPADSAIRLLAGTWPRSTAM